MLPLINSSGNDLGVEIWDQNARKWNLFDSLQQIYSYSCLCCFDIRIDCCFYTYALELIKKRFFSPHDVFCGFESEFYVFPVHCFKALLHYNRSLDYYMYDPIAASLFCSQLLLLFSSQTLPDCFLLGYCVHLSLIGWFYS